MHDSLLQIQQEVIACRACQRLVEWRERVGREKVRRFRDHDYWARPVPSFGDPAARLLVLGLAPAAHGGNRVGRIFTGDRSGDWLFRALHKAGFANKPTSTHRDDGLELKNCFITATARCAPPDNKPLPCELETCRAFLHREVNFLWPQLKVVVVLGKIAHDAWMGQLRARGVEIPRPVPAFGHLKEYPFPNAPTLLCSFHPSQQNTQTGKLTEPMFDAVWSRAAMLAAEPRLVARSKNHT
jgi:uracil-DNA glycosylase family 4